MLIYKSNILLINYLEVQYLLHIKFQEDLKILTSNELKAEFLKFFNDMIKRKGRHIFFDANRVAHIVDNEFISWFNRLILPLISSIKADKIAWLFGKDANELPKIEPQIFEKIEQKVFSDPKEVMNWLLDGAERKQLSFENGNKPKNHHHQ